MSKKSKKKNKSFYEANFGSKKKDSKKSNGKKNKGYYEEPKFKTVKPSLEKSDAKEQKKILVAPVEIPSKFIKTRNKCNHARDLITVEQFRSMTPTHDAFTPMLDAMIETFGEEHVHICKDCYDVLVDVDCLSVDRVKESIAVLYAAVNAIVSHKRMKGDEIKKNAELKNSLAKWNDAVNTFEELVEDGRMVQTSAPDKTARTLTEDEVTKLNRVNGTFVQ